MGIYSGDLVLPKYNDVKLYIDDNLTIWNGYMPINTVGLIIEKKISISGVFIIYKTLIKNNTFWILHDFELKKIK